MNVDTKRNQFIIGLLILTVFKILSLPNVFLFIGLFLVFDALFGYRITQGEGEQK
ncbi:MAG: hypothetical protein HKN00_11815 [Flavobacteriaceae bacterium]|nr:hypothetical protein [Bacteroidia bacterium]MBT8288029.1 hypothetical protein [Bacteroidia bacterium]NNF75865.1 hypothetical protein [Flavobacteriaceae bacterium]NNK73090.1 hypothetical protein [Flavobacteriaceae bacterium]